MSKLKQKRKKYLALILARKNSKRLKNKNIKVLGKKPLIVITLDNLIRIRSLFEDIIVSSDSKIVEKYTKQRKVTFIKRPANLALSRTSSENQKYIQLKDMKKNFQNLIILFCSKLHHLFEKILQLKK